MLPLVHIGRVGGGQVQFEVGSVVLEEVVVGQLVGDVNPQQHGGLVGPTASHVAYCVPAPAQHQRGHVERLYVLDALGVPVQREVEAAQPITGKRIRPALQHDGGGSVHLHDLVQHRLEHCLVGTVVDALLQGHVDTVVLAGFRADVFDIPSAWEEVSVFVEGQGHHSVRGVEGLLHPVPVVDVDVDVQNALVLLEQFEDAEDAVVHVAEA
mmetsp:Transcript_13112/g.28757  ORF Transcript_13112/g.28757 Transcript_13112/m.28757 type:complete len:211 (-) Transcript_13112:538-1170(-)